MRKPSCNFFCGDTRGDTGWCWPGWCQCVKLRSVFLTSRLSDLRLMVMAGTARGLNNVAKPSWVAGTPTLPFQSVFPGITNDIDTDVENLHRKYRQSRWLQFKPVATKIKDCIDEANNCGKDADVTRQTKGKTRKWQNRQKSPPGSPLRTYTSPVVTKVKDCIDEANNCGKDADATRQTKAKPRKWQNRQKSPPGSPLSPVVTKTEDSIDEANNSGKDADATRQTQVKPVNEQTPRRQNPRKWQNRGKMTAMHRRAKRLTAASSSKIDGWIDEANNYGKDADASATRQTKGNPQKWQNRQIWQKWPTMDRRAKRAAQQDSVTRLSRAKQPVRERISSRGYDSHRKPSRTSSIQSHSPRSANTTRRVHQNSFSMVCGVYIYIYIYIY